MSVNFGKGFLKLIVDATLPENLVGTLWKSELFTLLACLRWNLSRLLFCVHIDGWSIAKHARKGKGILSLLFSKQQSQCTMVLHNSYQEYKPVSQRYPFHPQFRIKRHQQGTFFQPELIGY